MRDLIILADWAARAFVAGFFGAAGVKAYFWFEESLHWFN